MRYSRLWYLLSKPGSSIRCVATGNRIANPPPIRYSSTGLRAAIAGINRRKAFVSAYTLSVPDIV
eukprot:1081768-Rhodomonas_salina.1